MATVGFSGMGSTMVFDGVTIGEIEAFDLGPDSVEFEEILTIDSTDYYYDVILTALNSGEMTFTCIFQPNNTTGNYAQLKTKHDARTKGTFTWTYVNTAYFSGTAAITGLSRPTAPDAKGVQRFTLTLKASGKVSYTGT
jgi:hypothetical protein